MAPATSLYLMWVPGRLLWRSMYSLTKVRNRMKPSVMVRMKMSVDSAQNRKVCWRPEGAKGPSVKEPCHTTSVTRMASNTKPEPKRRRLRMAL